MNKVGVSIIAFLAWSNYLKVWSDGKMEQYGPLPLEEEMRECRGFRHGGSSGRTKHKEEEGGRQRQWNGAPPLTLYLISK